MALRNSIFAVSGKASFMDARRDMSGLFVCDKTTMLPIAGILDRSQDNLVTGNSHSMSVTVHPFNAVLNRHGALLIQNDGNVNVPMVAAPSANSRIDVVYVKQHETRSPMSDGSDVPAFGIVEGTAAAVPVAPAVLLPAGVSNTSANGVVITQTYIGAAMKGDMLRVQTSAQRDALIDAHIVLQLAAVTDGHVLPHIAVLADGAAHAHFGGALDVTEVPHLGPLAELRPLVHHGGRMNVRAHRPNLPSKSVVAQSARGKRTGRCAAADR